MIKNTKGKKCLLLFPKGGKTKPKKKGTKAKAEGLESAVCVVGTPAF